MFVVVLVPNLINLILYHNTDEYKESKEIVFNLLNKKKQSKKDETNKTILTPAAHGDSHAGGDARATRGVGRGSWGLGRGNHLFRREL